MQDIIKEFQEEYENGKRILMKKMAKEQVFETMDVEEFCFWKALLKMLDVSENLIIAQANTIDEINKKLDRRD